MGYEDEYRCGHECREKVRIWTHMSMHASVVGEGEQGTGDVRRPKDSVGWGDARVNGIANGSNGKSRGTTRGVCADAQCHAGSRRCSGKARSKHAQPIPDVIFEEMLCVLLRVLDLDGDLRACGGEGVCRTRGVCAEEVPWMTRRDCGSVPARDKEGWHTCPMKSASASSTWQCDSKKGMCPSKCVHAEDERG